ncbi:MAG: hypothetical protein A2Y12_13160 [Planctomycetes bacterium GWF2_42_9]|nr:MAG: hypothetical protein A2Y12_13160 [Planctomycetes bacterium GWF2_42_9]HAL46089.1 hypothetical protein [Phycisphaerales bacterium]
MIIDRIARTVMENFEESEIILAIVDRDGCYVSSKMDAFEEVFADPQMLDEICRKIDDGCEPATAIMGNYMVAGSSINDVGYSILLVPNYAPDKAAAYHDFAEIVLSQIAVIAERTLPDSETSRFSYNSELLAGIPLN